MMFVFMPLMALVMLALYHSPPRFYVEHLVFFLHLQSDLFLLMILQMLLLALSEAVPALTRRNHGPECTGDLSVTPD
jgi:hypothetical protein